MQFRIGSAGSQSRSQSRGGCAAAAARPQQVPTLSRTGRQLRPPDSYEAVPSTIDTQRKLERQRQEQQQQQHQRRGAQLEARRAASALVQQRLQRPSRPSQQAQPVPQAPAPQEQQDAAQLPDTAQPHVVGGSESCRIMSDGSLRWRLHKRCLKMELPHTALQHWRISLSAAAIFILPDGSRHDATIKVRSAGPGTIHGWVHMARAMRMRPGDVLRLMAEPRRRGGALHLQLSMAQRGPPAAEEDRLASAAAQPAATDALPSFEQTQAVEADHSDAADANAGGSGSGGEVPAPTVAPQVRIRCLHVDRQTPQPLTVKLAVKSSL